MCCGNVNKSHVDNLDGHKYFDGRNAHILQGIRMRKISFLLRSLYLMVLAILGLIHCSFSQWSTSPYTQDALWVCPGFSSRIVTYPDGSSIIIGIGDNNEIWMQKLDPYGYKQWLPWVDVFPSISGLRYFLPDDDGGIYAIIGTQAQRVDKNGNLHWGENGKKIIPSGSLTKAITDGKNGFIGIYNYFDSLQRIIVFRYDSSGTKLWEKQIDSSSIQGSISGDITCRLGNKTLLFTTKAEYKISDLNGQINSIDSTYLSSFFFIQETDTTAYNVQLLSYNPDSSGWFILNERIVKLNTNWDTVWTIVIEIREEPADYLGLNEYFFSDALGGLFNFSSYYDTANVPSTRIRRISQDGYIGSERGYLIQGIAGRNFFHTKGKLGFMDDFMQAQLVDTSGKKLWPDTFKVIVDNSNSYFEEIKTDNNGGAVISFWTVAGGIKVQHTGRVGKVGVLTKINSRDRSIAEDYTLYQNYPNPFNTSTTIKFSIPKPTDVVLTIYDALGKELERPICENLSSGIYQIRWDANNYASGVYFYSIRFGSTVKINKMLLIK